MNKRFLYLIDEGKNIEFPGPSPGRYSAEAEIGWTAEVHLYDVQFVFDETLHKNGVVFHGWALGRPAPEPVEPVELVVFVKGKGWFHDGEPITTAEQLLIRWEDDGSPLGTHLSYATAPS